MTEKTFFAVSLEGGDSTGKATQAGLLRGSLESLGFRTLAVEVPVKSFITHRLIYFMLRRNLAGRFARFFHFLQFINKFWWQIFTLPFVVRKYDVLILDRWHGSYWVYGVLTGLDPHSWLMRLYHVLYRPDVTAVLVGTRHVAEQRDEYERNDDLQERVRTGYSTWSAEHPGSCKSVLANQDVMHVHDDILQLLFERRLISKPEKGI